MAHARSFPAATRRNAFIANLPAQVQVAWDPLLEVVRFEPGDDLFEVGQAVQHVYFPLDCVVALVNSSPEGQTILSAMVGYEGLVGLPAIMSGRIANVGAVALMGGTAARLPAWELKEAFERVPEVRALVLRFLQAFVCQIEQTALCNRHHSPDQQLCTMLMRIMYRLGKLDLELTHSALAVLLGLRRETVTQAAGRLQSAGLLQYQRGRIHVNDFALVRKTACSCYSVVREAYRKHYVPWGNELPS